MLMRDCCDFNPDRKSILLCHVNHFRAYFSYYYYLTINTAANLQKDSALHMPGIDPEYDAHLSTCTYSPAGGGQLWPQALRRRLPRQRDLGDLGDGVL